MKHLHLVLFTVALIAAGCSGGSQSAPTVVPPPPTPTPGALSLSPAVLAFTQPGAVATVRAAVAGSPGTLRIDARSCSAVASASAPAGTTSGSSFTVTALGPGTCTMTVSNGGAPQTLSISVTTTTGVIQ